MYADNGALSQNACILIIDEDCLQGMPAMRLQSVLQELAHKYRKEWPRSAHKSMKIMASRSLQLLEVWQSMCVRY